MKLNIRRSILFAGIAILFTVVTSFKMPPPAKKVKLGFISLTDCAPLVAAKELGLFTKYGVEVELEKRGIMGRGKR